MTPTSRRGHRGPVGFTADDHDYCQQNNAPPSRFPKWSVPLWNEVHADPSALGYYDFRFGDVHCLTLDGRRYADPVGQRNTPAKTKLGTTQRDWLESKLATTVHRWRLCTALTSSPRARIRTAFCSAGRTNTAG